MDVLWQDLRHALRMLSGDRTYTAVIVVTLAVGIGVNTAVFSLVHSILLEPLPYQDADRLAMVWTDIPGRGVHEAGSAYANVEDWRARNRAFEDLATFDPTTLTLTGGEWPEKISAALVSANLFSIVGVSPSIGRAFTPEEERRGAAVVVLSHDLWERRFGAAADVTGRLIEIGSRPFEVIGVMPEGFGFPDRNTQLWLSQTLHPDWAAASAQRGTGAWRVVARLRSDATIEQARADMHAIAGRLAQLYPTENAGLGINVVPLFDQVTGYSLRLALWTLFAAVGFVLLIACANVAHLILARGMDRAPEFALRAALGATAPRLMRQALTEHLLIGLTGGCLGTLLAIGGLRLLPAIAPAAMPRLDEIGVDAPVLVYALFLALAAGLLFGLAPALSLARAGLFAVLREGSGFTRRSAGIRARNVLIVLQFSLAIILVFGASLLIRSLMEIARIDPGFDSDSVIMANLSVESASDRASFYERVLHDVQAMPGVRRAALVEDLFISGAPSSVVTVEGRAERATVQQIRVDAIDGEFFQTVRVPFRAGRGFSGSDGADAPPVAIINETMARRFWGAEPAVGKRFRIGARDADAPWIEVIGVVGDMRRQGLERVPISQLFRPYAQAPSRNMNLLIRSEVPAPGLIATVRARVAAIDPTVPLYSVTTVSQSMDGYLSQRRFQTVLLGVFAAVALMLAAAGIYGLIRYSVARRTRELGMRVALGARPASLVWMIVRQGLGLALPGLAIGTLCAVWLADALSALLFGVAASDLTNIVVTSGVLLATTLVACLLPARRAARLDPMAALRSH